MRDSIPVWAGRTPTPAARPHGLSSCCQRSFLLRCSPRRRSFAGQRKSPFAVRRTRLSGTSGHSTRRGQTRQPGLARPGRRGTGGSRPRFGHACERHLCFAAKRVPAGGRARHLAEEHSPRSRQQKDKGRTPLALPWRKRQRRGLANYVPIGETGSARGTSPGVLREAPSLGAGRRRLTEMQNPVVPQGCSPAEKLASPSSRHYTAKAQAVKRKKRNLSGS